MSFLAQYRIINVERILRANIRPNSIEEDVASLINVLKSLQYIGNQDSGKATSLHDSLIRKLATKPYTIDLLNDLGYEKDENGVYIFQPTYIFTEQKARVKAFEEFQNFYNDLRKTRTNELSGFHEFIKTPIEQNSTINFHRSTNQSINENLPRLQDIYANNQKTADVVREFKQSITVNNNEPAAHSFIRRKLLILRLKQKSEGASEIEDEVIDEQVDFMVQQLKARGRNQPIVERDEIYYECLLRADLNVEAASIILREHRPKLMSPPKLELEESTAANVIDVETIQRLREYSNLFDENNEYTTDELLYAGDEWKNAAYILPAIRQLRNVYTDSENVELFIKMSRLLYCELSTTVRPQFTLKIEVLANALCHIPREAVDYLTMADIKDCLLLCDDDRINDDFEMNVLNSLSIECGICCQSFPRSQMEAMLLCNHTFCVTCAKGYYRTTVRSIGSPDSLNTLTCPMECIGILDEQKLNFFQWLGAKFNQWFHDERLLLELYYENLFLATRDSQIKKCGNPKCVGFFDNNNQNRIVRVQCPHCQYSQCQQCCRKWFDEHNEWTCDAYAEWLKDNDPDDPEVQLTRYLNSAGMICPNNTCNAVYEYQAGGCEHFTCPKCSTEFCRICSQLFYNPSRNTKCSRKNCKLKETLHGHCSLNCYREIRDASVEQIITLLTNNRVNVTEELNNKPQATGPKCPIEDCTHVPTNTCQNRFCERCYKQFLCLLIWRNEIEPWTLYEDNNLRQLLSKVNITPEENVTRENLIQLARQHLAQFLGKPKPIPRIRT